MSNNEIDQPDSIKSDSPQKQNSDEAQLFQRWSSYFSYKAGQLEGKDLESYELQDSLKRERKDFVRCEKWKEQLMKNSPLISFMLKELRRVGCPFNPGHFKCAPCDGTRSSGFNPYAEPGNGPVLLCQNGFSNKAHLEETMAHELIHAYDHCRYKVDWDNLYHYACSTVRATSLSGDCRFFNELKRGKFGYSKQHQVCVRRRSILAVKSHPLCPDEETATKAVNAVFQSCFSDTSPFDEIY